MPDTNSLYSFLANDPAGAGGYTGMDMRRRVALAMMARERKFPKTFGEGLSSIGDSIGDVLMQRRLDREAADEQTKSSAAASAIYGPGPAAAPSTPGPVSSAEPSEPPATRSITSDAPIVDPNEKNALDAQADVPAAQPAADAGYRPAPSYLQATLDRLIPDPVRRGYLGQLAGKEAQSPGEVSPTGAAGPFQFIRSTGQQYGLFPGGKDMRTDLNASTTAANALTDDNAKVLTERLGREPTPGELALAHQQGAVTAARMLTGAGNASARNLAVNNVAPGTDPGAAASKIMGYYGMPGGSPGAAATPRDSIAATLATRPSVVPGVTPGTPPVTLASADQNVVPPLGYAPAGAGAGPGAVPPQPPQATPQAPRDDITRQLLSPTPMAAPQQFSQARTPTDIQPAPAAPPIAAPGAAPPAVQQPRQTTAPPAYEMQKPVSPEPPPQPTMSPREANARRALAGPMGANPDLARAAQMTIQEEQAKSKYEQDRAVALYNSKLQHYQTQDTAYQTWQQNADVRRRAEETHSAAMLKAPLELEKERQAVEAGKTPSTKEVEGRLLQYDPVKRTWFDATPGGGNANPTLTEDQAKNLNYYQRGKRALADLGDGKDVQGFYNWYASGMPVIGNKITSTKFQEQLNATREFTAAILRRESGAAVQPWELENVMNRYIPRPGEPPELSVQKQFMREGQIAVLRDSLGKGTVIADRFDKTFDDERARLKAAKEEVAKGNAPDAGVAGLPPIRVNGPEERAALPKGRRYMRPGSDEILVKQ